MIFKSYILEQNIKSIEKYKIFLFYGENVGLKKDFKDQIKLSNKNKEILNFFQSEIIKDKNILLNEVTNKSLFDKEKIIFINEVNDKILDCLDGLEENIDNERIILLSGMDFIILV